VLLYLKENISEATMKDNIYRRLGAAVRYYRVKNGWTQEELGERAALHPSYIGQIERGIKKISILTLEKLSKSLKVKISDLLQEKEIVYKPTSWEKKLIGIIKDRPVRYQIAAYRLLKEVFKNFGK